ncbi:hypothetical protein SIN09_26915 [Streptomyces sp. F8]|uniref:Uncharacterized protein n=1 Tax=Streptomyces amritsarensis TaxID=681158 RepID=A0ABX3G3C9_9ACTN|nr:MULTISPECIES: hypothetical protein [Streptomyces]MDX6762942.1 hypothetical protein [Streptomyces sp. F8]OLZ63704.1 hypothetical protein AVW11_20000 [Streptomyces amritsarensis]
MAEAGGWIWERNLRPFLELLSHYVGYDFDGTDWETVALAIGETDDEQADGRYTYPLPGGTCHAEVRLARCVGGDEVSVTVHGPLTPDLRLRADTLLSAYAMC